VRLEETVRNAERNDRSPCLERYCGRLDGKPLVDAIEDSALIGGQDVLGIATFEPEWNFRIRTTSGPLSVP
jgi:hypothetical protein